MIISFMALPTEHDSWWGTEVAIWRTTVDALGHVTAAHYPAVFEEVALDFICTLTGDEEPSYVTAQMSIDYRRELLHRHTPVKVKVGVTELDDSSFELTMLLLGSDGVPRSMARTRYVAWDRHARRRRPLTQAETDALATHRRPTT